MKLFSSVNDVTDLKKFIEEALILKADPFANKSLGKDKTIGLVFLNPSLRTRLSTQKAALNLGMNVMVMNLDKEGWALETEDGVVMNGTTVEHIREAAAKAMLRRHWLCTVITGTYIAKETGREADLEDEIVCG